MNDIELTRWIIESTEDYALDRVKGGESEEVARRKATASFADMFPEGMPKPGHIVRKASLADSVTVGYLWIGPENDAPETAWWVWDIAVVEAHRGKGYGRQLMKLAEEEVRAHGGETLGLHVFGFNKIARELYESMDYLPTSIRMSKSL